MYMKVADIFTPHEVAPCSPDTPWREAAQLLMEKKISAVPVIDAEGTLVGILSEKDLFRAFYPRYKDWMRTPHAYYDFDRLVDEARGATQKTVKDVMSSRILTATPETPVLKIGALMVSSGIHQVPVVSDGKLVGMVSRGTIYRAILSAHFEIR